MPKFIIERNVPGAGKLTAADLQAAATRSNAILRDLGPDVSWLHSYVCDDKIYCVYVGRDEEIVREHARRCELPADVVSRVRQVIDPSSGESL